MMKLVRALATMLLAGGLLAVLAAPSAAVAPTSHQGSSRVLSTSCSTTNDDTGTYARLAGKVRLQEFGKQHVVQLRVKWLLYRTAKPRKGDTVARHFLDQTDPFRDDVRSIWFRSFHFWDHVRVPNAGLAFVARLTWVREGSPDWHKWYVVRTCR